MYTPHQYTSATARHVSRINGGLSTRFEMKLQGKIAKLLQNSREHNFCIVCCGGRLLWIPQEAQDGMYRSITVITEITAEYHGRKFYVGSSPHITQRNVCY